MAKKLITILLGVLLITAVAFAEDSGQVQTVAATAAAGQSATAAALPETPAAQPANPIVRPQTPMGISYGLIERFRTEFYNDQDGNGLNNDEVGTLKWRTRVWMSVPLGSNIEGYVRLANESNKRFSNASAPYNGHASPFQAGEIWFDNAYLNFKQLPGVKGLALKVGRQDILKNEGFIFSDGTGGDGSRSTFYNAFDLSYGHSKQKFELIGIYNPKVDDFFPVINGQNPAVVGQAQNGTGPATLNEWDQASIGTWYTNRVLKNTDIDAFYLFNHEYNENPKFDGPTATIANYMYQPNRHFSQFGGRVLQRLPMDIIAVGNLAYEAGTQDKAVSGTTTLPQVDIRAWASYGYVTKYFPTTKMKPYVRAVYMLLSGTDPHDSRTDGNWDPIYSRYPMSPATPGPYGYDNPTFWGLFPYIQQKEITPLPFYPTNLKTVGGEAGFTPVKRIQVIGGYQHANAMHPWAPNPAHFGLTTGLPVIPGTTTLRYGNGLGRFQMAFAKLKFNATKTFSGFISYEKDYFGNFYATTIYKGQEVGRNNGSFFRVQLNYRYSGFIPFKKPRV